MLMSRLVFFFSLSLLVAPNVFASQCKSTMVARCPFCPASMALKCSDGASGYVENKAKADTLTVSYFKASTGSTYLYEVKNPPDGVRSYYGSDLTKDAYIRASLKKQGVDFAPNDKLDVSSFDFKTTPKLYADVDMSGAPPPQPDKQTSDKTDAAANAGLECSYVNKPTLVTAPKCADTLCVGMVACTQDGSKMPLSNAGCASTGSGICPSANDCAKDGKVVVKKSKGFVGGSGADAPAGFSSGFNQIYKDGVVR